MPFFDMPLDQLQDYVPGRVEADNFDAFWDATLSEARSYQLSPEYAKVDFGLTLIESYDVTYSGYGGQRIKAWLLLPSGSTAPLPCVVEFIGYGGGRGFPLDWLKWTAAGYATLVMDTRGQGSRWRNGDTPDPEPDGANPHLPGFMTKGILAPQTYYYRRVFTDAVRAIETARAHDRIDPARIIATGRSQGGGISLAVAGLVDDLLAIMPDVPFLCHYRRATHITDRLPYDEISGYLKIHRDKVGQVFETLSYFDGLNFAARAKAPALFSAGLMDFICPPSTVFAAYNHYAGPRAIELYEYNDHEGGETYHIIKQLQFMRERLGT